MRSPALALTALSSGAVAYAVLLTVLAPLIPRMVDVLHRPLSQVSLVLTLPLISGAVMTPLLGRYGDMRGKRRMMVWALFALTAGSVGAALTTNFVLLLVARIVQGAASAVFPLGAAIIRDEFPAERVRGAISVFGATFGVGSAIGLVLGGLIASHTSGYRPVFWFAALLSGLAFLAVLTFVSDSPTMSPGRLDLAGAALLSGVLVCLLLPLSEASVWGWTSALTLGLLVGSVLLAVAWVRVEQRVPDPLVNIELFVHRPVLTTNISALLIGVAQFASFIGVSDFVQADRKLTGYGFSANVLQAGLYILPSAFAQLAVTPFVVILARRYDDRIPLVVGGLVGALSLFLFAFVHDTSLEVLIASALMGAGIGMSFTALPGRVVHSVVQSQSGIATGMNNIMRTIGQALGTTAITALLAAHLVAGTTVSTESGYTISMVIAGACILISAPLILLGAAHATEEVQLGPVDLLDDPETAPHAGI